MAKLSDYGTGMKDIILKQLTAERTKAFRDYKQSTEDAAAYWDKFVLRKNQELDIILNRRSVNDCN